jgi:hypothetical protein
MNASIRERSTIKDFSSNHSDLGSQSANVKKITPSEGHVLWSYVFRWWSMMVKEKRSSVARMAQLRHAVECASVKNIHHWNGLTIGSVVLSKLEAGSFCTVRKRVFTMLGGGCPVSAEE